MTGILSSNSQTYKIDFIPPSDSVQGFLRLILELENETILGVDPHIGFSHRGIEKILENKSYLQGLTYFDRLDAGAPLIQEQAFVLGIEKLLGIEAPPRARYIRVLLAELTRLLSHFLSVGSMASTVGSNVPFNLAVESREKILEIFEIISGARFFPLYFRPGGVQKDLPPGFFREIGDLLSSCRKTLQKIEDLLSQNFIFKQRTVGMGSITSAECLAWGLSGPLLRAAGVAWDLRHAQPYDAYEEVNFKIPVGTRGDAYDRYLVYMEEMYQSLDIITQCLEKMPEGMIQNEKLKLSPPPSSEIKESIESLIVHSKIYTTGFKVPEGRVYSAVESPRGEFGVLLVGDGSAKPYRCRIRSAGFSAVQALECIIKGHKLSDLSVILASLNISSGEIDR
jgi:NADH-quinone oxidoreductase subunit D